MDMTDAELLRTYDTAIERYPLEGALLWHRDPPRTSQRMICEVAADPTVDAVLVSGGHGTGKTHIVAMLAVATAAGRRAPWVQEWCRRNAFPLERFPDRMGRALVSGLTGHDLRRFLKPKLHEYLPRGCVWRNEDGDGESEVILPGAPNDKRTGRGRIREVNAARAAHHLPQNTDGQTGGQTVVIHRSIQVERATSNCGRIQPGVKALLTLSGLLCQMAP